MRKKILSILLMITLLMQGVIPPVSVHAASSLTVLDLTASDKGSLDVDGYHWDLASRTLEISSTHADCLRNKEVILPGAAKTSDNKLPDLTISCNGGTAVIGKITTGQSPSDFANLIFKGPSTIIVDQRIETPYGIGITVNEETTLKLMEGASLYATSNDTIEDMGKIKVYGKLEAYITEGSIDPALSCNALQIEATGEVFVSGDYGVKIVDLPMSIEEGTGGKECNKLYVKEGAVFYLDSKKAGIWISDSSNNCASGTELTEKIEKHFVVPNSFLQSDYEIQGIQESENPTGSAYIIVKKGSTPSLSWEDISNAGVSMFAGLHASLPDSSPVHEDSGKDITLDTNLEKEWIYKVRVNGTKLTPNSEYTVSSSPDKTSIVFKADFLKTLYRPGEYNKAHDVEIEFRPMGKTPTMPTILKSSFIIDAHKYTSWIYNETDHWIKCSTCNKEFEKANHTLEVKSNGTDHWKECSVCGQKRNEAKHTFGTEWEKDDTNHWHECVCGAKSDQANHTFVKKHDKNTHWEECSVCGQKRNEAKHTFGTEWKKDDTNHWHECACGEKDQEANHTFVEKHDKNTHWEECSVCGQKRNEAKHTFGTEWKKDDTNHWHECACGEKDQEANHTFVEKHDKNTHWEECSVCGQKRNEAKHTFGAGWKKDDTNHWHECSVCGAKSDQANHTFVLKYYKNIHWEECSVCGQKRNEANHTYKPNHDKTHHWEECTCGAIRNKRVHTFKPNHDETYHWDECACGEIQNKKAHTYEWIIDKAATEEAAGSKHQECTVCHHKLPAVEIPKLPHTHKFGTDWKSDDVTHWHECACGAKDQEAKHTLVAKHDGTNHWQECSVCGKVIQKEAHTFAPKHDEKNHWDECSCGEKRNMKAHTYEWIIDKAATEEAAGSKHQECTVCHHKLPAVEIPKLPHTHKFGTDWKSDDVTHWHECACGAKDQEANHTLVAKHDGTNHWQECSVCGKVIQKEAHTFVPKHDEKNHWDECSCGEIQNKKAHTYEWIIDKAATEEAAGSKHQECTVCHHKLPAVEIPKLPHTHKFGADWQSDEVNHWHECACGAKDQEAKHTLVAKHDGTNHWQECSVCGKVIQKEAHTFVPKHDEKNHWEECSCGEIQNKKAHTYEWIIDKAATEEAAGSKHQECTVCHHKLPAVEIPKLPPSHQHEFGSDWKSDDTNHWHECACGEKNEVAAHTLEWIVDKEATEEVAGVRHQECTICHHKLPSEEIPKLPHTHQFGDEWKSDGTNHWHECVCGAKNEVAAHTYEWIVEKEATEETVGVRHQECTVCHHKLPSEEIPKLPHTHQFDEEWNHDDTNHWHGCSCGEKNEVAAHTYEWIIDKEATTTETGMKHQHCTVCGYDGPAVEIPMEKPKYNIYKVVQGAEQIYNVSRKDGAFFRIDGPYQLFKDVYVDGVLVDPSGYVSREGSTIIHFTKAYMNTLSLGRHSFKAEYIDGEASTTFTIVQDEVIEKPEEIKPDHTKPENILPKPESETPKTGDSNNLAGYMIFLAAALIIIVVVIVRRKRK